MSRFFVGQRVRIVRVAKGWEFLLGKETHIVSRAPEHRKNSDWQIALTDPDNGGPLYAAERNIEPILPAHQPVAIADLLSEFPSLSNALGVSA